MDIFDGTCLIYVEIVKCPRWTTEAITCAKNLERWLKNHYGAKVVQLNGFIRPAVHLKDDLVHFTGQGYRLYVNKIFSRVVQIWMASYMHGMQVNVNAWLPFTCLMTPTYGWVRKPTWNKYSHPYFSIFDYLLALVGVMDTTVLDINPLKNTSKLHMYMLGSNVLQAVHTLSRMGFQCGTSPEWGGGWVFLLLS